MITKYISCPDRQFIRRPTGVCYSCSLKNKCKAVENIYIEFGYELKTKKKEKKNAT